MIQVDWSHQLAAFKAFLDEALEQSKDAPERGIVLRATAIVTAEVQSGISVHAEESKTLQASYLGILHNALNQLQVNISLGYPCLALGMLPVAVLMIFSVPFWHGILIAQYI